MVERAWRWGDEATWKTKITNVIKKEKHHAQHYRKCLMEFWQGMSKWPQMFDNCNIPFYGHFVVHFQPNIKYRSYSLLVHYRQHKDNVAVENVSAYGYVSFPDYVNCFTLTKLECYLSKSNGNSLGQGELSTSVVNVIVTR